ncbi:hypothetical protein D3C76_1386560 [compost metagenome]
MPHNPVGTGACAYPAAGNTNHAIRMILGDIIQIVSHTLAYVQRRIILQLLQHRQNGGRIAFEHRQRLPPRQTRTAAFAGKPAHMLIAVPRPD